MAGTTDPQVQLEALAEFLTLNPVGPCPATPGIYSALHQLANRHMAPGTRPSPRPEAGPVASYIRLLAQRTDPEDRSSFYFEAARLIRQMHVEAATPTQSCEVAMPPAEPYRPTGNAVVDFRAIDLALTELEQRLPLSEWVTELHYFTGLNEREVADLLNISTMTVAQELRFSRAWLQARLRK